MATFADDALIYDHELYVDWAGWDDDWTCQPPKLRIEEREVWRKIAMPLFYVLVCWLALYGACNIITGWRL